MALFMLDSPMNDLFYSRRNMSPMFTNNIYYNDPFGEMFYPRSSVDGFGERSRPESPPCNCYQCSMKRKHNANNWNNNRNWRRPHNTQNNSNKRVDHSNSKTKSKDSILQSRKEQKRENNETTNQEIEQTNNTIGENAHKIESTRYNSTSDELQLASSPSKFEAEIEQGHVENEQCDDKEMINIPIEVGNDNKHNDDDEEKIEEDLNTNNENELEEEMEDNETDLPPSELSSMEEQVSDQIEDKIIEEEGLENQENVLNETEIEEKLAIIKKVKEDASDFENKLLEKTESDTLNDKDILYFEEMFMKCMLRLDDILSNGSDVVRKSRKEVIDMINKNVDNLIELKKR